MPWSFFIKSSSLGNSQMKAMVGTLPLQADNDTHD